MTDNLFFKDEACFHLNRNSTIRSAETPHALRENSLHLLKNHVWCAVSRKRIVGLLFFEDTFTAEN